MESNCAVEALAALAQNRRELIDQMLARPIPINRPVVVHERGQRLR
jgi:arsenate reductase-like glutaredoxin family protein